MAEDESWDSLLAKDITPEQKAHFVEQLVGEEDIDRETAVRLVDKLVDFVSMLEDEDWDGLIDLLGERPFGRKLAD